MGRNLGIIWMHPEVFDTDPESRLADAVTGEFADSRDMPWYATALFVSQPLHFGDYGGMPLKIIWAVLDVITIIVLWTGLYLWLRRRKPATGPARAQVAATRGIEEQVLTS